MDSKLLFDKCLAQATKVIGQVKAAQYGDSTPDTEWDVQTLTGHIFYELSWVPDILAGKTVTEVGAKYDGDLIGDDLLGKWQTAADKAKISVTQFDLQQTIHLSYGDYPAEHYIKEVANDLCIHAWDLGVAIGLKISFDPSVAEELYTLAQPHKDSFVSSGLFAPPLAVDESSDTQTKLLAIFGRDANWQPPKNTS